MRLPWGFYPFFVRAFIVIPRARYCDMNDLWHLNVKYLPVKKWNLGFTGDGNAFSHFYTVLTRTDPEMTFSIFLEFIETSHRHIYFPHPHIKSAQDSTYIKKIKLAFSLLPPRGSKVDVSPKIFRGKNKTF